MRLLPLLVALGCAPSDEVEVPVNPHHTTTEMGIYTVHLTPDRDPWVAGEGVLLTMMVQDSAADAPAEGIEVEVVPYMPDMGHGIHGEAVVDQMGSGMCEARWVFPMSGYWELTVDIDGPLGADRALVAYEVE